MKLVTFVYYIQPEGTTIGTKIPAYVTLAIGFLDISVFCNNTQLWNLVKFQSIRKHHFIPSC